MAVYHDKETPQSAAAEFAKLLQGAPRLIQDDPFQRYLLEFPRETLPNVENFVYWSKEKIRKPVVSVVHACLQRVERDGEAIEAYRGYVAGGGKALGAAERAQFAADQTRLELGSAVVTLQTEPDGAWIIDERIPEQGKPIVNRYGPTAGGVELRLRAWGGGER